MNVQHQAHLPAMVCGLTGRELTHGEVREKLTRALDDSPKLLISGFENQVQELALKLSAALQTHLQPGSVVGSRHEHEMMSMNGFMPHIEGWGSAS